jgi:hypothetical protein
MNVILALNVVKQILERYIDYNSDSFASILNIHRSIVEMRDMIKIISTEIEGQRSPTLPLSPCKCFADPYHSHNLQSEVHESPYQVILDRTLRTVNL